MQICRYVSSCCRSLVYRDILRTRQLRHQRLIRDRVDSTAGLGFIIQTVALKPPKELEGSEPRASEFWLATGRQRDSAAQESMALKSKERGSCTEYQLFLLLSPHVTSPLLSLYMSPLHTGHGQVQKQILLSFAFIYFPRQRQKSTANPIRWIERKRVSITGLWTRHPPPHRIVSMGIFYWTWDSVLGWLCVFRKSRISFVKLFTKCPNLMSWTA